MRNLLSDIDISRADVANATSPEALGAFLQGKGQVESDVGGDLLLHLVFRQPVALAAVEFSSPSIPTAPSALRLFANKLVSLDAAADQDVAPSQEVSLSSDDVIPGKITRVLVNPIHLSSLNTLTLYCPLPMSGDEDGKLILSRLSFLGLGGAGSCDVANIKPC
jgi:hypothetical protein